ncbi:hypothetical protein [Methylocystis sp. ATCC 49242]|uniref:hypothetical protein n=1 Tax=Methylocystis sp. ATCC 49242 TaxID=622637 RepID=UPI0001F87FF0|nr:hypothetical protein [Methylocystis sp. ATCC 49242]
MPPDAPTTLGPFRLRVDPERARAYGLETGGDGSGAPPLCYPALWLTDPALFDRVKDLCAALDVVPVHESQSFDNETPLVAGESYDVSVTMRREETPPRLVLEATVATPAGGRVARIETVLRLVPRAGLGSAS